MKIQKRLDTEFFGTKSGNTNAIAVGYATETTNYGEIATGILNKSTRGKHSNTPEGVVGDSEATLFSVGCGTSKGRKNALEVKGDGSVIISGGDTDMNVADKIKEALNIENEIELVKSADSDLQYTLMVNNKAKGLINIPKDQFLKNVVYDDQEKQLVFTFVTLDEDEHIEKVPVGDLKDIYTAGDNIIIENNKISADLSTVAKAISDEKTLRETTDNEIKSTLDTKADKSEVPDITECVQYIKDENGTFVITTSHLKQDEDPYKSVYGLKIKNSVSSTSFVDVGNGGLYGCYSNKIRNLYANKMIDLDCFGSYYFDTVDNLKSSMYALNPQQCTGLNKYIRFGLDASNNSEVITDKTGLAIKLVDLKNASSLKITLDGIIKKDGKSTEVFATDGSLFDTTTKADVTAIPTKLSQLTNDTKFITSYTETDPVWTNEKANYYTKTEIDGKGYLTEHQSLTDYAKKSDILAKLNNITEATTADEVVTKFNALLTDLKAKGYMEADTTE